MMKMKTSTCILAVFLLFVRLVYSQSNTWIRINDGFAKCALIHNGNDANLGGEAERTVDNFTVRQLLPRRGEMYAFITFGNAGSNPASCEGGLFKHDTLRNLWLKVADMPGNENSSYLISNNTDIFVLHGSGNIQRYTTDYGSFPDGWRPVVTGLKGTDIPNMSCVDAINFGPYSWLRFAQAVGDTIYTWSFSPCGNPNQVVKFYTGGASFNKSTDITVTQLGQFPNEGIPQTCNTTNSGGITSYIVTAPIGGIFQYFFQQAFHGRDLSVPYYVWVFEPRAITWKDPVTKQDITGPAWRNISKGPDWRNITGSSNPVDVDHPDFLDATADICDPTDWTNARTLQGTAPNPNGPSGQIVLSQDKTRLFVSSETGVYEWIGNAWVFRVARRENSGLYPTGNGIYQSVRLGLNRVDGPNVQTIGQSSYYGTCLGNKPVTHLSSPDDGITLYAVRRNIPNDPTCTGDAEDEGIYRLQVDINGPATTRNLGVESATFLGDSTSAGNNKPVNVGVAGNMNHFVAGNYNGLTSPYPFATYNLPATAQFPAAVSNTRAKIIQMSQKGDSVIKVINVGTAVNDTIFDFEVMNSSPYRMIVSGTFGFRVLDSLGNLLWGRNRTQTPGGIYESGPSGEQPGFTSVDIADDQSVVVLRGKTWRRWNANGTDSSGTITFGDNYVEDITMRNDTVYVTGYNNANLGGIPNACGETASLPVQSSFIKRFKATLGGATPIQITPNIFGLGGNFLGSDQADTRGYRVNVGKDGKLYFLGETAGGNGIFRWNGRTSIELGADGDSATADDCDQSLMANVRKIAEFDQFSQPFNTSAAHLSYFCTINPNTGLVDVGQYIIPRLPSNGKGNTYRVKDGYIHADEDGYVYVAGGSACCVNGNGRDVQKINGQPIAPYTGEDMALLIVTPNYATKTFWGVFAKEPYGRGRGVGIGNRGKTISFVGEVTAGNMHTRQATISKAIDTAANSNSDAYLAVWYQDVWNSAKRDSIIETVIPGDTVVSPDELTFNARFSISNKAPCQTTGTVDFTDNTTIPTGWSVVSRLWEFGSGASPATSTAANPTGIVYTTAGLKTPRLTITIQKGSETRTSSSVDFYKDSISVSASSLSLGAISGENVVCPNYETVYSVNPPEPGVFSITSYTWTVPSGATILSGQGTKSIRVKWGSISGNVSVSASFGCATPATASLAVTVNTIPPATQAFMLVNSLALTTAETKIRNTLQGMGYTVTIKEDNSYTMNDAKCKGLVVITNSNDTSLVDTAFRSLPQKMVVMDSRLFGKLNMTSSQGTTASQTQLNISTSNGTPATYTGLNGGVPTGNQTLVTSASTFGWGVPHSTATHLASIVSTSNRVFFAYDSGADMTVGKAPHLRIGFGFSDTAVNNTNAAGDSVLFRAFCYPNNTCNLPTISLTKIDSVMCYGDTMRIRIKATGASIQAGNVYTVQLSDNTGSFSVPTILGTFATSSSDTTVKVVIPTVTPAVNLYRVRVNSSSPLATGVPTTNVSVLAPASNEIIYIGTVTGSTVKRITNQGSVTNTNSDPNKEVFDSLVSWFDLNNTSALDTVIFLNTNATGGLSLADVKCKGLVIVGKNAGSANISFLRGLNVPILFMDNTTWADASGFGVANRAGRTADSYNNASSRSIRIVNNTHPITSSFTTGDVEVAKVQVKQAHTLDRFNTWNTPKNNYLAVHPSDATNKTMIYYEKGDDYRDVTMIDTDGSGGSDGSTFSASFTSGMTLNGTWTNHRNGNNTFGGRGIYKETPSTTDTLGFTLVARVTGVHEVLAGYARLSNSCNTARYTVITPSGTKEVTVDQSAGTLGSNDYGFAYLDTVNLNVGDTVRVNLSSPTGCSTRRLWADAVIIQTAYPAPERRFGFFWSQDNSGSWGKHNFDTLNSNGVRLFKNSVCWLMRNFSNHPSCLGNVLITTGELIVNSNDTLCGAENTQITFTANIDSFNVGNVFTVQLSDSSGSFASPTTLATLTSRVPDTIKLELPETIASGGNYKIRVTSSSPAVVGSSSNFNHPTYVIDNSLVAPQVKAVLGSGGVTNVTTSSAKIGSSVAIRNNSDNAHQTEYVPTLPSAGNYVVQVFINDTLTPDVSKAAFRVYYNGGVRDVLVDVTSGGGNRNKWVTLGLFPFAAGNTGSVRCVRPTAASQFLPSGRFSSTSNNRGFNLDGTIDTSTTSAAHTYAFDAIRWIPVTTTVSGGIAVDSLIDNPTATSAAGSYTVTNGRVIISGTGWGSMTVGEEVGPDKISINGANVSAAGDPGRYVEYRMAVPSPGSYWVYRPFHGTNTEFCGSGGEIVITDSIGTTNLTVVYNVKPTGVEWGRLMKPSSSNGAFAVKDTLIIRVTSKCSETGTNNHVVADGFRIVSVHPTYTMPKVDTQSIRLLGGVNIWVGNDTVWNKRENWTCRVPDRFTDVVVPASPTGGNFPSIIAPAEVRTIRNFGTLRLRGGADLIISDSLNNQGTILSDSGSVVRMARKLNTNAPALARQAFISSTPLTLSALAVNNDSGLTLSCDLTLRKSLIFTAGKLFINDKKLTLDSTLAISGNDATKYIVTKNQVSESGAGFVRRRVSANGSDFVFPVGTDSAYAPVTLRNTGTRTLDFEVRTFDGVYSNGLSGTLLPASQIINRTWQIDPHYLNVADSGLPNIEIILSFTKRDTTPGFQFSNAYISNNRHISGDNTWKQMFEFAGYTFNTAPSGAGTEEDPYRIAVGNVRRFSVFGVGSGLSVLPVVLTYFRGTKQGEDALLTWATSSEHGLVGFGIEKSHTSSDFREIGFVDAKNQSATYRYIDPVVQYDSYYRLKIYMEDGRVQYSQVVFIPSDKQTQPSSFILYPNPTNGTVTLQFVGKFDESGSDLRLELSDITGKSLVSANGSVSAVNESLNKVLVGASKGVYIVSLRWNGGTQQIKLIKE